MPNQLSGATSPYLLQHANNPVEWHEWGPEALDKAHQEDKPIFLSIGYAACHWCHVMAHESFEDPETAHLMNEQFVSIKVDREERPDIDALYMDAVVAMTGHGGWPMSVFLTPDGRPFFGGTYYPPIRRHNLPSFRDVLMGVSRAWKEDRERLLRSGAQLADQLAKPIPLQAGESGLELATLSRAAEGMLRGYDWKQGGWGGAPKFPQATSVEFLLRKHHRDGDTLARDMALHALDRMAAGGLHDQVAGGFHRYTVDGRWQIPHFEKMLYDNALLALAYLHGWQVGGGETCRDVVEDTLGFLLREMRHPSGGLYASLDADSGGEEGKFYLWELAEIEAVLNPEGLAELFVDAHGVTRGGNLEGRNVLRRAKGDAEVAAAHGLKVEETRSALARARALLLEARGQRVRPATDDKVLTAWNGLALSAFACAARALQRDDYLQAAQELAEFLLENLVIEGDLNRAWRQGRARFDAYLEDHAALGEGLLDLYQADFDSRWLGAAAARAEAILEFFPDPLGGYFDVPETASGLFARPKSLQDTPTPSGNALAISLLLHLSALTGEPRFAAPAEAALAAMQPSAAQHPNAFAAWLCALDFGLGPQFQLAIVGDRRAAGFRALAEVAQVRYTPRLVCAGGPAGEEGAPALLKDREPTDSQPTAFLCQQFTCNLPTTSPTTLEAQLAGAL